MTEIYVEKFINNARLKHKQRRSNKLPNIYFCICQRSINLVYELSNMNIFLLGIFFSLFLALVGAIFMAALEGEMCAGFSVQAIFQSNASALWIKRRCANGSAASIMNRYEMHLKNGTEEEGLKSLCPTLTTLLFIALIMKETALSFSKMIDRCEG